MGNGSVTSKLVGLLILCWIVLCRPTALAEDFFVTSPNQFEQISKRLAPDDQVILANGIWRDFEILFKAKGTKNQPITLRAEQSGKVILSGQSNLRLAGEHLVVKGLVFKDGYTPSGAVIAFRQNKTNLAFHSRVTETVIDNYNNPDKQESDYWVALYGQYNRFDHNHLVGKRNKGVTLAVRLNSAESQKNYHRIDHNYFGYRPTFGSNGGETIRIGTSHYSLTDSYTLVENNYFEQTNGEVEIISVKSGKNNLKGNVFYEAKGTLTLRHGNGNVVEENIFIGNGIEHTGGIRVINKQQHIRNNYLEGLTGYRFGSGFTVMNGVPNSPINRYHQVENAQIEDNSFINVRHIQLAAGSDAERSAVPMNSTMKNNLLVSQDNKQPFSVFDNIKGIKVSDNVTNTQVLDELEYGFSKQKVALKRQDNGLLYPTSTLVTAGAKRNLKVISKQDTGVIWYPKTSGQVDFGTGETVHVTATAQALISAVNTANNGDILILADGEYIVPKLIKLNKAITIRAKNAGKALLSFERTALFEINNGGNLTLDGLTISGKHSPDAAGNSVVRTQKWGMLENYRLIVRNCAFQHLDINHSFHFFTTGKGAFADQITLVGNTFDAISGDILVLNTEIEDLGIYNAEYVTITENRFQNVLGAIVKLYRGGTDESTFGPHLRLEGNILTNIGSGKRNKTKASIYLHGVQVTNINTNTFANTAPIVVEHTVAEPKTVIEGNIFNGTNMPNITELNAPGPHTAYLRNNRIINQ